MKTSFYFVLWILIYPLLGLINNSFIDNNSFFVAIAVVWGLSWLLNRLMPETLTYERVSDVAPILESVYTGNVTAFGKRLSRETVIETVTAIYFLVTTFVIGIAVFKYGVNDWFALIVFGFFTYGAISRSVILNKARVSLKDNPLPEQCMEIADGTYKLDYASYYEERQNTTYEQMLPPRPRFFKVFQVFSIVVAVLAAILGLIYIALAIIVMMSQSGMAGEALAGMYFLYGSLAAYFGIKDCISIIQSFRTKTTELHRI
ncbi:MAG: hypothetical protein NC453_19895 [Muribaculum sp.]|nr:hypothetical protein [Muribaculum sp.]